MGRRIWIVSRKTRLTDKDFDNATLNGCSEVANGIPPALIGKIAKSHLPIVWEEALTPSEPKPDIEAIIDDIDKIVSKVDAMTEKQLQLDTALHDQLEAVDNLKAKLKAAGIEV